MKQIVGIIFSVFFYFSYSQTKQDIVGEWQTTDGERKISIYKEAENYFGKIVWVKDASKKDEIGKIVIKYLKYEDGEYDNGEFIMPSDKHSADCAAELTKSGLLEITIYHGVKLFGHSMFLSKTIVNGK